MRQRKMDVVVRVETTLLGTFLDSGRGRSTLSQIGITARSAGRASDESADVKLAPNRLAGLQAEYPDFDSQIADEMDGVDPEFTSESAPLETVEIRDKQFETHIVEFALAWVACQRDLDGQLTRT